MADHGRPLPKFGDWDVNNPASAEGFTVIFSKARDDKKTNHIGGPSAPQRVDRPLRQDQNNQDSSGKKRFCCF